MSSFAYAAPESLEQALAVLKELADKGKACQVLAGGTDLLVQLRLIDPSPRTLVDIKKLAETNRLDIDGSELYIGAAIPAAELTANETLKELIPGLIEATDLIGSTQIQGRATIGGNLCNASPAGDTISALIVNQGKCVIASSTGTRELPVEDFVTGVGSNALEPGELLLGLTFPRPSDSTRDAYLRFIPRTEMDIAVAGAGVSVTLDDSGVCTAARVAIGAVAPTTRLVPAAAEALIGSTLDKAALMASARASSAASSPISDKRGTADYRRKVVGVLTKRAAAIAADRVRATGEKRR